MGTGNFQHKPIWHSVATRINPLLYNTANSFSLDTGAVFHYTYANGKEVPPTLPYNTAGSILKGKHMQATVDSTLYTLLHSAEVKKNIKAEAQRKAEVQKQTARAMDRANREWR